MEGTR